MTTDPAPTFPHLPSPSTPPARRRYAIACRASAIVLDREGQSAAAAALRDQAAHLEQPTTRDLSSGDAA